MKTNILFPPHEAVAAAALEMSATRGIKNPYISAFLLESVCAGNETLEECFQSMCEYCFRYAETVCKFEQIVLRGQEANEDGSRAEIETVRGRIHDATMTAINVLSRALNTNGKDNSWMSKVVQGGRASYGKFAILIAFELVINNNKQTEVA